MQLEPRRAQVVYESQLQTTPVEAEPTSTQSTESAGVSESPSLEERLNQVTATPESPTPVVSEATEQVASEPTAEPEETQKDEGFEQFGKQLEEYFGIKPDELREMKEFVETARAAQAAESLRNEWGVDKDEFDNRMQLVLQRFETLPPNMQQSLDNNEGIKLLWTSIQAEQGSTAPQRPNVPTFDRGGGPSPKQSPFLFTQSELNSMPSDQYGRMNAQILLAYANGQVDLNN